MNKFFWVLVVLAALAVCGCRSAKKETSSAESKPKTQKPAYPSLGAIERTDKAINELIAPDAKLKTVAAGFGFSDGPVWVRGENGAEGYLLAVSIIGNVIYKVTAAGKVSVFLDKAGYSGEDFANVG